LAIAIIQEQLVPLFETVPTDAQLRTVIDKVLALAAERGVGVAPGERGDIEGSALPPEEQLEPEELKALTALEARDFLGAKAAYQEWLNRAPGQTLAQLGLAQVELLIRIDGLDIDQILKEAAEAPENVELQIQAADCEMAQGNSAGAFDRLISIIKITTADDRKKAQGHLVGLFLLVDPADPLLKVARQKLASALF
jgi:putative thioredoxin